MPASFISWTWRSNARKRFKASGIDCQATMTRFASLCGMAGVPNHISPSGILFMTPALAPTVTWLPSFK